TNLRRVLHEYSGEVVVLEIVELDAIGDAEANGCAFGIYRDARAAEVHDLQATNDVVARTDLDSVGGRRGGRGASSDRYGTRANRTAAPVDRNRVRGERGQRNCGADRLSLDVRGEVDDGVAAVVGCFDRLSQGERRPEWRLAGRRIRFGIHDERHGP